LQPRDEALAAHRAGALGRAEALYRRALEHDPEDLNVLHMLGVLQLTRMRYRDALDLLWDAAERTSWAIPKIRGNLGRVLAKLLTHEANRRQASVLAEFLAWEHSHGQARAEKSPLVTVVLPAYNHARFVAHAIASVAAQTYPHIELVAIDDGSVDGTAEVISESLASVSLPVRFIARENRGAPATLNEGAALARGQYLAFLNSDDYFAPDRIACMVDEIVRKDVDWGFSLVSCVSEEPGAGQAEPVRVPEFYQHRQRARLGRHSNSLALVEYNICISTGNLFVKRDLFLALGGFRDYRYHHDWDFCLRAAALAEPMVVHRPLYFHRGHGGNTISESGQRATEDATQVFRDFLATALSGHARCNNPLGPHWPDNRILLLKLALGARQGALVPVPVLRSLAANLRAAPTGLPSRGSGYRNAPSVRRAALVVLGMHRSGTSALARVLNLCGAFLPAKLVPPNLGANAKGFWEPEEVVDLNERCLGQLGGAWNRVAFSLPGAGELVDEFVSDARALLASEYGDQETILIKDPRICVLAPLWHRALLSAGYRPVYVVSVRNPMEVAQSLHARGDMTVAEGLSLWLTYMRRVAEFADVCPDVMHVRFTDLLDDWRKVVGRIAERLDVPLVVDARAEEVDRFLEPDMHRQVSNDDALDVLPAEPSIAEIRSLHRTYLARCDRDASSAQRAFAAAGGEVNANEDRPDASATANFVLCIENNAIRDQALLLCESIRRFGGRYSRSPILAFAPRPGLGVDEATRRALADMDVEYVSEPLNTCCPEYGSANRVFAAAWTEERSDADFIVVLDSDTLFFGEPELPMKADVAVRPVDSKGSATRGPGDPFEEYWATLATMCGTSIERLPFLCTTIASERIRASYNGGLIVARREKGTLVRWADLFARSVRAGMRPYRGGGMDVYASTGPVGKVASEYWGSNQAALALAIWATTDRVVHYQDCYNVPLHLLATEGEIDPRWLARPPVHLHYHWMFGQRHHEIAMEILTKLGVPTDRLEWLKSRIPFRDPAREIASLPLPGR
jgi:GT2 family glycosyltransferase